MLKIRKKNALTVKNICREEKEILLSLLCPSLISNKAVIKRPSLPQVQV